jgi:hypothetical protein
LKATHARYDDAATTNANANGMAAAGTGGAATGAGAGAGAAVQIIDLPAERVTQWAAAYRRTHTLTAGILQVT